MKSKHQKLIAISIPLILVVILLVSCVVSCVVSFKLITDGMDGMCGKTINSILDSPKKDLKAYFYYFDCGATTAYTSEISVLDNNSQVQPAGNVYIFSYVGLSRGNVAMVWTGDYELTVTIIARWEPTWTNSKYKYPGKVEHKININGKEVTIKYQGDESYFKVVDPCTKSLTIPFTDIGACFSTD